MSRIIHRSAWSALALALAAAGLATAPTSAVASPAAPTAQAAAEEVLHTAEQDALEAARRCYVTPRPRVGGVKVRRAKTTRSTPIAQINRGERGRAACSASEGGWYSGRGCTRSNWWVRTTFKGRTGWVAVGCVRWYSTR